ncbi:MAG TPA: MATE family efflux transporter [Holophaga sp.]|nr:MATE family efflux transporter [Holophaga sp.]HPS68311.1 MATE family efflux transporter [Holophaga sp.]
MQNLKVLDFKDRAYYADVFRIGLPVMLQNLIFNGLALVDNVMIGGKGDAAISAVGVANKLSFVFALFVFGVNSGANMFCAQFWGKGDLASVRKVLGISMRISVAMAVPFLVVSQFMPRQFMTFFIRDPQVVEQGAAFLRIMGWSYLVQAVTSAYAIQSRGVGRTRPPFYASAMALAVNTALNYVLIYGRFGFPALGVRGSALATLVARSLELGLLLAIIYGNRYELAASWSEMGGYSKEFLRRFIKPVTPVIANEVFWSIGVSLYTFFYGMQGVQATTTAQIMEVMSNLFFSVLMGLGNSCGTMIGNRIGAQEEETARVYAKRSVLLGVFVGLVVGAILALSAGLFLSFFDVSPGIHDACRKAAYVYGGTMFLRSINMIVVVGVCRSAGDTVFAALIDVLTPWCIGIPMAALGVMVLHWPIHLVILLVTLEEWVKAGLGVWRLLSGKWLNNLVRDLHGGEVETPAEAPAGS